MVGAGVVGLAAARALAADGFAVTVYERDRVGTLLGSSPGRSRIFRRAYRDPFYVRLAVEANRLWDAIDAGLLRRTGLLVHGAGCERWAEAMQTAGIEPVWLDAEQAGRRFPEGRFDEEVLWDADAGAVLADRALAALADGLVVREGRAVDPRELDADVVAACPGAWLGSIFGLDVMPRIEQVAYFAGAPDDRPSLIQLGAPRDRFHYGLIAPGIGYKIAEDGARTGRWDPDRPDRPVDPDVERRLCDHVRRWFPGLDPRPVHREACLYTMTRDSDFVLDTIDGVSVFGGDSGHAFKLAPVLGRMVADLCQGRALPPEAARRFRAERLR